jgi:hypothetical protein
MENGKWRMRNEERRTRNEEQGRKNEAVTVNHKMESIAPLVLSLLQLQPFVESS